MQLVLTPHCKGDPLKLSPAALLDKLYRVDRISQRFVIGSNGSLTVINGLPKGIGLFEKLPDDWSFRE